MSDRQVAVWETGGLSNVKTLTVDQSAGVIMPFWTDNDILFLGMCFPSHSQISADVHLSRKGVRFAMYLSICDYH